MSKPSDLLHVPQSTVCLLAVSSEHCVPTGRLQGEFFFSAGLRGCDQTSAERKSQSTVKANPNLETPLITGP